MICHFKLNIPWKQRASQNQLVVLPGLVYPFHNPDQLRLIPIVLLTNHYPPPNAGFGQISTTNPWKESADSIPKIRVVRIGSAEFRTTLFARSTPRTRLFKEHWTGSATKIESAHLHQF